MEEKYVIWHVQGGLGKNIAATALIKDIKEKYKDRKFILVCSFPEIFLNNPDIDKVYNISQLNHFYETYIENKDVIIFKHEPYFQSDHITKKKHLVHNWCDLLNIEYKNQQPKIYINYSQTQLVNEWKRSKPVLLLNTNGGPLDHSGKNFVYNWARDLPIEIANLIVSKYKNTYHIIHLTRPGAYKLEGVERIEKKMSNLQLISLVFSSSKRILIDSAAQHAAAAFNLKSDVFWIGTSPILFGYKIHNNLVAKLPKKANQLINSYDFDYQFHNNVHECPYMGINEMFDLKEILNNLES